jgi:isoquinoline 1-oxidoreductase beta subunit
VGEINAANGRKQQTNFNTYPVARINEGSVETRVHIVPRSACRSGRTGFPPMSPATCNATFAATGKRIGELPIKKQLTGKL